MKIQDIVFLLFFLLLAISRNPRLCIISGLVFLVFSIPLFSFWIFFTAERFVMYAAAFFLLTLILFLLRKINFSKIK